MGIAGLQFNIVNIILSALIFGLGDDYSLFIMDGLLQEYKTGKKNLSSYKSSIVLSAITTLAGLGVLIFARHPGTSFHRTHIHHRNFLCCFDCTGIDSFFL